MVFTGRQTTKAIGDEGEALALQHLQRAGLVLVERNYRVARGPHARGGEIDLILRERGGTVVFVEVRSRSSNAFGGAGSSIGAIKQQRVVFAARYYLLRYASPPPCRFDAVLIEGQIQWIKAAFDAQ